MKKKLFAFIFASASVIVSAQLPTIHSFTVIPVNPISNTPVKIVTRVSTPNAGFLVDKTFTVSANPQSVKLHLCYANGFATVLTDHIDTFAVGQLQPGAYSIRLSAYMSSAGQHCARVDSNFASLVFIVNGIVGIKENTIGRQFQFYPNPASDHITIASTGTHTVRIFSLQGQLVRTLASFEPGRFSLGALSAGMYLLEITNAERKEVHPIIIE